MITEPLKFAEESPDETGSTSRWTDLNTQGKGSFTLSESERGKEKDQRTIARDQRKLSRSPSLDSPSGFLLRPENLLGRHFPVREKSGNVEQTG